MCNATQDEPAVRSGTLAGDVTRRFELVDETRYPCCLLDHPLANGERRQPLFTSAAQDAEDVVLRQRHALLLDNLGHRSLDDRRGAQEGQKAPPAAWTGRGGSARSSSWIALRRFPVMSVNLLLRPAVAVEREDAHEQEHVASIDDVVPGREYSFGEWLIPPTLGMKIIPIGPICAISCASCPAPLGMHAWR